MREGKISSVERGQKIGNHCMKSNEEAGNVTLVFVAQATVKMKLKKHTGHE